MTAEERIGTFAPQAVYQSSAGCALTYPQAPLVFLYIWCSVLCSLPNYAEKSKAYHFKRHKFSRKVHKFSHEKTQIQPKDTKII